MPAGYPAFSNCTYFYIIGVGYTINVVTSATNVPPGMVFNPVSQDITGSPTGPVGISDGTINGLPWRTVICTGSHAPSITSSLGWGLTVGVPSTIQLTGIVGFDGTPPLTWSKHSDVIPQLCEPVVEDLPPGCTFNSDGSVTGTPTTPGVYICRIIVLDAGFNPNNGRPDLVITVSNPGGGPVPYSFSVSDTIVLSDSFGRPYEAQAADGIILSDALVTHIGSIGGGGGGGGNCPPSTGGIEHCPGPYETDDSENHPSNCIFEFYEMMAPENVETLPVPKRYDQLGPMRFDKIAKIFGFRIRLIMNGGTTTVPYYILGDDSPSSPTYANTLFSDSFPVQPGIDEVYEIQLPKSVNSDIVRLVIGPTADSFHRYDVLMKVQTSGLPGQSKWVPIR